MLGDIHNRAEVFAAALRAAVEAGCDALVQIGDFWLQDATWAGWDPLERRFEALWGELMWRAVEAPIPVIVIDGNHEVWPCLTGFLARTDTAGAQAAGRPLHLGRVPVVGGPGQRLDLAGRPLRRPRRRGQPRQAPRR